MVFSIFFCIFVLKLFIMHELRNFLAERLGDKYIFVIAYDFNSYLPYIKVDLIENGIRNAYEIWYNYYAEANQTEYKIKNGTSKNVLVTIS